MTDMRKRSADAQGLLMDLDTMPRKGYAFIQGGGNLQDIALALNTQIIRRMPPALRVPRPRGAVKAFSFHWSNAQAAWHVMIIKEFPWPIDGAEFIVFVGPLALSPLGKVWTLTEMQYVAKRLRPHPGYAGSFEGGTRPKVATSFEFFTGRNEENYLDVSKLVTGLAKSKLRRKWSFEYVKTERRGDKYQFQWVDDQGSWYQGHSKYHEFGYISEIIRAGVPDDVVRFLKDLESSLKQAAQAGTKDPPPGSFGSPIPTIHQITFEFMLAEDPQTITVDIRADYFKDSDS